MLRIESLHLSSPTATLFQRLTLSIAPGEIVTLMGPSGAGKSSLLHWMIGDLDPAFHAEGALWLGPRRVDGLPTELRRIGILFQDDLLFAHLSVGQNLAFALPAAVRGAAARRAQVEQTLDELGLAGFHDRDPATLSGGQRARVSLMRALLAEPQALLLDEPFARLDIALRTRLRAQVFEVLRQRGVPTLLVSHDPADVPPGGRVIQIEDCRV